MVEAIIRELHLRQSYLNGQLINSVYFGGGTPSLLDYDSLRRIMDSIHRLYDVSPDAEITLEANPDDLDLKKISELSAAGFNRLSIGIQSFRDEDMKLMNRAHTASQADYAVKASQDKGFENITIDLIYSVPGMDLEAWKKNLYTAFDLRVQHISAYSLTFEPKTVFGHYEKTKKLLPVDQKISEEQYLFMVNAMNEHGFDHYEVSNFGRQGYYSRHNTSYWKGEHYLGVGPSAHSFNGESRQWNVANNPRYIASLNEGKLNFQIEELDDNARINEAIMTGLRTKWGVDVKDLKRRFDYDVSDLYREEISNYEAQGKLVVEGDFIKLTEHGMLFADGIASEFFRV